MGTQDWLYGLLHAPLKRGERAANQIYLFFRVVGKLLDRLTDAVKLTHDAGMVLTAPAELLAEHGRDRDMARLPDEDAEAYRLRLAMAAQTAELAGTRVGLQAALSAMGLTDSYTEPYYRRDPARWAEFVVWLVPQADAETIRLDNVDREIRRLKEVGSKPNYGLQPTQAAVSIACVTKYGLRISIGPQEEDS